MSNSNLRTKVRHYTTGVVWQEVCVVVPSLIVVVLCIVRMVS